MSDTAVQDTSRVFAPGLRLARILWRVLPMGAVVLAAFFAGWLFDANAEAFHQVSIASVALLGFSVVAAFVREVLSPDRPWLRILPVTDIRAHRLDMALRWVLFFATVSTVGIYLVYRNDWRPDVADALRVLRNIVIVLAAAIVLGTTGLFRWLRGLEGDGLAAVLGRFTARVVFPILTITLLVFVVTRGLGYHPLSAWVLRASAWTILKILAAVLVYRAIRRALYRSVRFYAAEEGVVGLESGEVPETNPYALGLARIVTGLVRIALVVVTFLWVLRSWSLSVDVLREVFAARVIAGEPLTWGQVFSAAYRVTIILIVGWFVKSVLVYFVLPRTSTGVGGRYAILAVLRYTVIGLALVIGLGTLGVSTESLNWFFGAAGIGLAFGLQDVISNFVSGLIMLVERPIRVGDLVQVGTTMGNVEEIRMRGTVLRTFDNTTILIPNSQMLGERVTNLTHGMAHSRIKIQLLVPHDTDPGTVEKILLGAAERNERVLKEPAPFVWFDEFSPSSLDFVLVCFTSELRARIGIASKMRFDIVERLREAGIEPARPQQDVHIHGQLPGEKA